MKQEQTEDLYVDRVLHETAANTGQAPLTPFRSKNCAFESAMDEVEDVEDRAALRQTAKEQKTVQQEMSDVRRGAISFVSLYIRFYKRTLAENICGSHGLLPTCPAPWAVALAAVKSLF